MEKVECTSCTAACCRKKIAMPLSEEERSFMEVNGAELEVYGQATPPTFARKLLQLVVVPRNEYVLTQDCAHLVESEESAPICGKYESPQRPKPCRELLPGSFACRFIRFNSSVDSLDVWKDYLDELHKR